MPIVYITFSFEASEWNMALITIMEWMDKICYVWSFEKWSSARLMFKSDGHITNLQEAQWNISSNLTESLSFFQILCRLINVLDWSTELRFATNLLKRRWKIYTGENEFQMYQHYWIFVQVLEKNRSNRGDFSNSY